jgi:hypothetical protein
MVSPHWLIDFVIRGASFCLIKTYSIKGIRQCEPVGRLMVGECYQLVIGGLKSGP